MTTHELAALLLNERDLPVHLAVPTGDYLRTILATPVVQVALVRVRDSAYHRCDVILDDEDEGGQEVVILR